MEADRSGLLVRTMPRRRMPHPIPRGWWGAYRKRGVVAGTAPSTSRAYLLPAYASSPPRTAASAELRSQSLQRSSPRSPLRLLPHHRLAAADRHHLVPLIPAGVLKIDDPH